MDWIYAHLIVNHFPIVLAVVASIAALIAALTGREWTWRHAAGTGLLAGIAAPIAFLTGQRAEEIAESLPGLAEEAIELHEHWGLYALIALAVAGLLAILALVMLSRGLRWAFAIGMWVATAITLQTAKHGGEIEHPAEERAAVEASP